VTRGEDVLELLGPSGTSLSIPERAPLQPTDLLDDRERQILDAVPVMRPASGTSIARTAGVAATEVERTLLRLGRVGLVERAGPGWRRGTEQSL
jgi:DNA processing protein